MSDTTQKKKKQDVTVNTPSPCSEPTMLQLEKVLCFLQAQLYQPTGSQLTVSLHVCVRVCVKLSLRQPVPHLVHLINWV